MKWEKLEIETTLAYEWFCRYRDMGIGRSHVKLVQAYGKNKTYTSQIQVWSKKYNWVSRVEAYDLYLEEKKRSEMEDEKMKAARGHFRLADVVEDFVWEKLPELKETKINALQWRSLAEFAVKTKRDALGFAEKHEISTEVDVSDKFSERISKEVLEKTKRLFDLRGAEDEITS
ncbi:MAG: hypothetical protein WDA09_07505 [Bacteriovoracaceae bacterium]